MNKNIIIVFVFFVTMFSCKPSSQEAGNYYDLITAKQDAIVSEILHFADLFDNAPITFIDSTYKEIMKHLDQTMVDIDKIKPLTKDDKLKPGVKVLLKNLKTIMAVDYKNLIVLYKKDKDDISSSDGQQFDDSVSDLEEKIYDNLNEFAAIQQKFVTEYDLKSKSKS